MAERHARKNPPPTVLQHGIAEQTHRNERVDMEVDHVARARERHRLPGHAQTSSKGFRLTRYQVCVRHVGCTITQAEVLAKPSPGDNIDRRRIPRRDAPA